MCSVATMVTIAVYMPRAEGQSICQTDDHCDTASGYYCNVNLFECVKCVTCENFKEGKCAKSTGDCGATSECLQGYSLTKDGRCISSPSATSTVTVVSITVVVVLIIASIGGGYVLQKKRKPSGVDPEKNANPGATPPTAPDPNREYLEDRPPPYNYSYCQGTDRPINDDCFVNLPDSTDPLLNSKPIEYKDQPHTERMQRANLLNPPCYVRGSRLPYSDPTVPPQAEESPPAPAPENVPLQNIAGETQEPDDEENQHFIGPNQPPLQQLPMQINLTVVNTNSTNQLSFHQFQ